jgi:hypothetical protein
MNTLSIVDGMHTIVVVWRRRWINSYWMTKISKSLDDIRIGRPEEPIIVVVVKLHTNCTLSFVRIGINCILNEKACLLLWLYSYHLPVDSGL